MPPFLRGLAAGCLALLAVVAGLPCPEAPARGVIPAAAEAAEAEAGVENASSAWCGRETPRPPVRIAMACPCGCDEPGLRPPRVGSASPPRPDPGTLPWHGALLAQARAPVPIPPEHPIRLPDPVPILQAG